VVRLDQNRDARGRSRQGPPRGSLETHLLATMASTAALMEATARIQKQAAEALQALAVGGGDEDAVQRLSRTEEAVQLLSRTEEAVQLLSRTEEAVQLLSRVEHAIRVLTSVPGGRRDWRGRPDRRLRPAEPGEWPMWPAEPLTAREAAVLRLLPGTLPLHEIGQELGVSKNTVKSQVQAIYRKLGVSCRHDAIERGRELSLLLAVSVRLGTG
jgi:ATP/maltotriose-dependent transcriptional regulator MalT